MTKDNKGQKKKPVRALKPGPPGPSSRRELQREAYLAKWRSWDWSKQDVELAEEMGSSKRSIGTIRRRIGAPKSPRWHKYRSKFREPNRAKWRSWDWSKQNAELAREKGLSNERVRQIRHLLGAPKSPHHNHKRTRTQTRQTLMKLQWAAKNLDRLKGLSAAELRRKYGFDRRGPVYEFLKARGVLRDGNYKHRWDLMNWELPSLALERVWKLPFNLAACYRSRKRPAGPRWTLFGGPAALQRRGELRAYNRAVQAEERKAAKYFAESGRF
jgi:hypothetical protein